MSRGVHWTPEELRSKGYDPETGRRLPQNSAKLSQQPGNIQTSPPNPTHIASGSENAPHAPKIPSTPISPFRSKTEALYADLLELMKRTGQIRDYAYEPIRIILTRGGHGRKGMTLTPDFLVITADGRRELHEVKGWMRPDAEIKTRWTEEKARLLGFAFCIVRLEKGGNWSHTYLTIGEGRREST